jgi:hypothetical protein
MVCCDAGLRKGCHRRLPPCVRVQVESQPVPPLVALRRRGAVQVKRLLPPLGPARLGGIIGQCGFL